jgi:hypothetical protein
LPDEPIRVSTRLVKSQAFLIAGQILKPKQSAAL